MSDVNKIISDDQLSEVSGGAGVTSGGFPYDNKGNVLFTDTTGKQLKISAADWAWLKTQYDPVNPEADIRAVPARDIEAIINQHNSPFK